MGQNNENNEKQNSNINLLSIDYSIMRDVASMSTRPKWRPVFCLLVRKKDEMTNRELTNSTNSTNTQHRVAIFMSC